MVRDKRASLEVMELACTHNVALVVRHTSCRIEREELLRHRGASAPSGECESLRTHDEELVVLPAVPVGAAAERDVAWSATRSERCATVRCGAILAGLVDAALQVEERFEVVKVVRDLALPDHVQHGLQRAAKKVSKTST